MGRLLSCMCLFAVAVVIAGCGAHSSHAISTGGDGDLRGVRTIPDDGERNVDVDETIRVYWVTGYDPPPEFRFVLRDHEGVEVATVRKSSSDPNEWRFEPYGNLDYYSRYTIEISYGDSRRTFVFWTEEESLFMLSANESPKEPDPGDSEPQLEHRVVTRRGQSR